MKSYKKHPCSKDMARNERSNNRNLRHKKLLEVPNGSSFKKLSPFWRGYRKCIYSRKQAEQEYYSKYSSDSTLEEWMEYYEKHYVRK